MAFSKITVKKIDKINEGMIAEDYTSLTAALASNGETSATVGGYFEMEDRDDKYLLLVQNGDSAAQSFTVKASNAQQGVNDYTCTLAAGKYTALAIESGRFKWISSNDGFADLEKSVPHNVSTSGFSEKGKVFVTASDVKIKVAVFRLPV